MTENFKPDFSFEISVNKRPYEIKCHINSRETSFDFYVNRKDTEKIGNIIKHIKEYKGIQQEIGELDENCYIYGGGPIDTRTTLSVKFLAKQITEFQIAKKNSEECFCVPNYILAEELQKILK